MKCIFPILLWFCYLSLFGQGMQMVEVTDSTYLFSKKHNSGNIELIVGDVLDSLALTTSVIDEVVLSSIARPGGNISFQLGGLRDVVGNGLDGVYLATYKRGGGNGKFLLDSIEAKIPPAGPLSKPMVGNLYGYLYNGSSSNNPHANSIKLSQNNTSEFTPGLDLNQDGHVSWNGSTLSDLNISRSNAWRELATTQEEIPEGGDGYFQARLSAGVNLYVGLGYADDRPDLTGSSQLGTSPFRVYIVGWDNCRIYAPDIGNYKTVGSSSGFRTVKIVREGTDIKFFVNGSLRHTSVNQVLTN